eukprot:TRINITY_DN94899_c0_g1_i1.p1 TRINITY_DN94899_c0_g1~~TRINITY_DN94899_c0_g1_i1.p1  ORF type:complete len:524 (+),score=103.03 TRINITY_DN94899_c0_g1_i1:33-1574(+)
MDDCFICTGPSSHAPRPGLKRGAAHQVWSPRWQGGNPAFDRGPLRRGAAGAALGAVGLAWRARLRLRKQRQALASLVASQACSQLQSVRAASEALARELERLCHSAEAALTLDPPGATWLPEGCEGAPPDIMKKLVQMSAGAGKFPPDEEVDALWRELEASSRAVADLEEPLPSWSFARLRSSALEAELDADAEFGAEFQARWRAVQAAIARGLWTAIPDGADADLLEVYATHLTNDDYVLGAEVLAASLQATGTARPLVALVTQGVSEAGRHSLRRAGWLLVEVGLAGHEGVDTAQARGFFSKIWLWALPFSKVVYIDTDILVLRNLDTLFATYSSAAYAATPDSQPHMDGVMISQTGFLFLQPSTERFSELWTICSGADRPMKLDDWRQFEQGFLTIFHDGGPELAGFGGGCKTGWQELPAAYNFTVRYCKRPLFDDLGPTTAATIHFACAKPWDWEQRNFAPAPYLQLYLEFVKAAGIRWKAVECAADRARDRVNQEKMRKIQAERALKV